MKALSITLNRYNLMNSSSLMGTKLLANKRRTSRLKAKVSKFKAHQGCKLVRGKYKLNDQHSATSKQVMFPLFSSRNFLSFLYGSVRVFNLKLL